MDNGEIFAKFIEAEAKNRELMRLLENIKPTDLRDQFAMAALTGLLAANRKDAPSVEVIVDWSFYYADAMLKAREESK